MSADKVWGLLYGEIFVNLESYSKRTPEIKTLLLEGYKKLFTDVNILKDQNNKSDFTKAVLEVMNDNAKTISNGITPDALSALRTRFILEWYEKYPTKFAFRLFEHHRQLAKEGMFDAYNQWIFGAADNLSAFQLWATNHAEEYTKFTNFQKNRVFKIPKGQYYQVGAGGATSSSFPANAGGTKSHYHTSPGGAAQIKCRPLRGSCFIHFPTRSLRYGLIKMSRSPALQTILICLFFWLIYRKAARHMTDPRRLFDCLDYLLAKGDIADLLAAKEKRGMEEI